MHVTHDGRTGDQELLLISCRLEMCLRVLEACQVCGCSIGLCRDQLLYLCRRTMFSGATGEPRCDAARRR
jgi:hypothetical protein